MCANFNEFNTFLSQLWQKTLWQNKDLKISVNQNWENLFLIFLTTIRKIYCLDCISFKTFKLKVL